MFKKYLILLVLVQSLVYGAAETEQKQPISKRTTAGSLLYCDVYVRGLANGDIVLYDLQAKLEIERCSTSHGAITALIDLYPSLSEYLFVSGSNEGYITIWPHSVDKLSEFKAHDEKISTIIYFKDNLIISSSEDKTVKVWDISNREEPILVKVFNCEKPVQSIKTSRRNLIVYFTDQNWKMLKSALTKEALKENIVKI